MEGLLPVGILAAVVLVGLLLIWWRTSKPEVHTPVVVAQPEIEAPRIPPLVLAVAQALDDGLLVIEADQQIIFANAAVGPLIGMPKHRIEGQSVITALRDYQADQAVAQALQSGETQVVSLQSVRSGRTIRLTCRPLAEPESGAVIVLRDLTQIAQLERARREMVANVSHELRTPLASIRLLVETLTREPPPDLARRMLGQIDDELAAMTQLVDELRELSQIESGRLMLQLSPVSLPALITRTIDRLQPQAERRTLTFHTEFDSDLVPTMIDEERIGQVLLNLLHNALKWTPAGGNITVSAINAATANDQRTQRELAQVEPGDWIKLSVRDTGIGIPRDETERVFERFYKVDRARTRDSGGTGLGLAIAKHLVERHGGRIWAESREGHGSTFSMLLPTTD